MGFFSIFFTADKRHRKNRSLEQWHHLVAILWYYYTRYFSNIKKPTFFFKCTVEYSHLVASNSFTTKIYIKIKEELKAILVLLPPPPSPAGESNWQTTATGVVDCYYNVTELPAEGAVRFRVACVNQAGQGPYSGCSPAVSLHAAGSREFFLTFFADCT